MRSAAARHRRRSRGLKARCCAWLLALLGSACGDQATGSDPDLDILASGGAVAPAVDSGGANPVAGTAGGAPDHESADRPTTKAGRGGEGVAASESRDGGSGGEVATAGATAGTGGAGASAEAPAPPTVFIAGDSTVMTYVDSPIHQAGWGQFFASYFVPSVTVENRAIGGRTSRRFVEEDRLSAIADELRPGDYLFVQFGTNDSNMNASYSDGEPYFLDAATDFKTWMQQYITAAEMHGATPVLVTPPPRNSCQSNGTSFNYSFGRYETAMHELAEANDVAIVDLGRLTIDFLDAKRDCDWASENFFLIRADGSVDGTHFQEIGADRLASLVAQAVASMSLSLGGFLN
jgi:lysophospholipase L1-like esterase